MVATGFAPFSLLLLLGMPLHLPLSLPPLPPDPTLAAMAPQDCLWYIGLAGVDKVNSSSKNKVEQLLAEDDVVNFQREVVARLERSVTAATQNDPRTKVVGEEGPKLVATLLSRPLCAYIASAAPGPRGPMVRGGLAVNLGNSAAATKASLEKIELSLEKQIPPRAAAKAGAAVEGAWHTVPVPPDAPPVQWGIEENYLIVGIGEGEADALWARRSKPAPDWLTKLIRDAKVPRPAIVQFINLNSLVGLAKTGLVGGTNAAQVQQLFDAFGLNNLKSYSSVGGLDADAYVETALISTSGQPLGLLSMLGGKSLTADSLSPIPDDAGYAVATRIDPSKLWEMFLKFAALIDPNAPAMIDQGLAQIAQQTTVNLKDDLVASLGDTWCLYNSPGDGGLIFTGLTVTGTIRDRAKLVAANEKLVTFARQFIFMAPAGAPVDVLGRPLGRTTISEAEFRGQKIFFVNFVGERSPVSPAWCITDSQLVVGLFPQTIKAYLQRQPAGSAAASAASPKASLAQAPEVAALFSSGGAPALVGYQDTANTFRFVYPLAQIFADFAFSELQQEGVDLDISILPNARAIRPHLKPSTFTLQSTGEGIRLEAHGTLPSGLGVLPLAASALLPATFTARQAAERVQSMNNLKQISLALLNFESAEKSFPPAFDSNKDGKPLLSWRVLMLPYIGEQQLYNQFHLDEPWDSENNKKLIAQMPRVFAASGSKAAAEFKTVYLGVRGEKAAFTGVEGVEIRSFTDGTSNTITVVEANDNSAVIWTKPDDFAIDTPNPAASLVGLREGGFLAAFADGHVQMIADSAPANVIKALFTRNGGEVVDLNAVSR
jgi:Protein of unknown function (DUF1559)